jgi:hypothetical protein
MAVKSAVEFVYSGLGGRRGVAKVGHKLGHFRKCWYGSHTASAVLQMKIVVVGYFHLRNYALLRIKFASLRIS